MNGNQPRKREKILSGRTTRYKTGCGWVYITVNRDKEGLFEIFAHLGKSGQCGAAQLEAICRSVTAGLRAYVDPKVFIKQFKGIKCPSPSLDEGIQILSCADAIATAIELETKEATK